MIHKTFFFFFFLFCSAAGAQSRADALLGKWLSTDRNVAVEIFKKDGDYRAKVLWFDETMGSGKPLHQRHDTENPDPDLRKRKIIGMEILDGLQYNSRLNSWEKGRIYDASSGRYWDSAATITANGLLKVRGYWKYKWIGKTMTFTKTTLTALSKL
ncbi:DUF2147 domain-containing protein [Chryseobacterium sp.]|uniref:DUF2147 domain-containing protein n=1 Tax=Chryseobacterium sp. TaxID=1871047 RepID=UPI0011C99DD9|nr:DUF2147 domain-containing protein [Chryseobacterium sp.]TXF79604.1 DUF2147 domain-containing protein [Chryseobacterium sp.]